MPLLAGRSRRFVGLTLGAALLALLSCAGLTYNLREALRDRTPRGPLTDVADWPEPLRELHEALGKAGVNVDAIEAYHLDGTPGTILSTVVCRMPHTPEAWDAVRQKLDLRPVPADWRFAIDDPPARLPPGWWPTEPVERFASRRLLEGEEGALYFVVRRAEEDHEQPGIFIHYHFNF